MSKLSITAQRNLLTKSNVERIESILTEAGLEYFRTEANFQTITFEAGEIDGKPVYASLKLTLHKADYSLDDAIEEYELNLEDKTQKAAVREEKKALAAAEAERKKAIRDAQKAIDEKKKAELREKYK